MSRLEESYDAALKENTELIAENKRLLSLNERYKQALKGISGVQEASWEYYVDTAYEALEE